jgi:hypothetical protein
MRGATSSRRATMKKTRTQYRTSKGNKRYLKRDAKGRIVDNQSYKRAHGQDVRRKARGEK